MIEADKNIYCSWNWERNQKLSNKMVTGLIFGYCGVGKSRLMNNLCNTTQKVGIARQTITKQLFQGFVKQPNQQGTFSLFDSPGIHKNDNSGSFILRRSLKFLQWNIILIQAKLQARFQDSTLTQLVKLTKIFGSQQQRLQTVYLVSHADILDQNPKNKKNTLDQFKKSLEIYLPNRKVILYSNENSNFSTLSRILYSCAVQFNACTFDVEDKKFCRSLGYTQNTKDKLEDEIRNWYAKIKNQPQIQKKAQMLNDLKNKIPEAYDILKYHVNQMHLQNESGNKVKQQFRPQKPTFFGNGNSMIDKKNQGTYISNWNQKQGKYIFEQKYIKLSQNNNNIGHGKRGIQIIGKKTQTNENNVITVKSNTIFSQFWKNKQ